VTAPAATPAGAAADAGTVLVVDDTETKRYVLASWLRRAGYTVREASTGGEALAVVAAQAVDAVVLDVHLPDLSGLDVCAAIKSRVDVPVLHVSAVAVEVADRARGLDRGADAYLVDPIEPQEFLSTVRALLRSGRARRTVEQARRSVERVVDRLEALRVMALRMNVGTTAARLAAVTAEGAARILRAPVAVVLRGEQRGGVAAVCGGPDGGVSAATLDSPTGSLAMAGEEAEPAGAVGAGWAELLPPLPEGRRWRFVPVRDPEEGVVGAIAHAQAEDTEQAAADELLVGQLVEAVAVAHQNLKVFAAEHRIALTLQRSLLPATLPTLPGLAVAARYRASTQQAEIGGDFFDAFECPDGSAVLVIGDVQGHSLTAAVVMAELRYSLRAYALDGRDPAGVVTRLNRLLVRGHPDTTATVCTVTLSPDRRRAEIVNAGHLPPLLLTGDGAWYLPEHGLLLGVDDELEPVPTPVDLPAGARLLLATDGLVERRDVSLEDSLAELREVVTGLAGDLDAVSDQMMSRYGETDDDVAFVIAQV
jgi:DNA-binding response OmpR family regulator/serine phosphatase RsbU (regulator of sigma subunit)